MASTAPLRIGPADRQGHDDHRQVGFGIVEVIVATALLAIMLAVASPSVSRTLDVYRLRGAARHLSAELHRVRGLAVMQNNPHRFWIDGDHAYAIHDDDDADDFEDPTERVTIVDVTRDSPGITFSSTDVVTFASNGTAFGGGTFTVRNLGGDERDVVVSGVGRVRIR